MISHRERKAPIICPLRKPIDYFLKYVDDDDGERERNQGPRWVLFFFFTWTNLEPPTYFFLAIITRKPEVIIKKGRLFFLIFFYFVIRFVVAVQQHNKRPQSPDGLKTQSGPRARLLKERKWQRPTHHLASGIVFIYIHLLLRVLYVRIGWHIRHSQRKWEGEAKVELTRKRAVRTRSIGAESSSSSKPKALSAKWHLFLGTDNICHAGPISEEHLRSRKPNIFPPIFLKRKRGGKKTHLLGLLGSRPVRP